MADGNNHLDLVLLTVLVLFLAVPIAGIALFSLIKGKKQFSLLSILTALRITAIKLGYASYVVRK